MRKAGRNAVFGRSVAIGDEEVGALLDDGNKPRCDDQRLGAVAPEVQPPIR